MANGWMKEEVADQLNSWHEHALESSNYEMPFDL